MEKDAKKSDLNVSQFKRLAQDNNIEDEFSEFSQNSVTKRNIDRPVIKINNVDLELSSKSEIEMVLKFDDTKKEEANDLDVSRFRY